MVHTRPNDGFMTQLLLYAEIEHDVNVNRTAYRRFLIASNAAQRESKLNPWTPLSRHSRPSDHHFIFTNVFNQLNDIVFGYIEDMTLAADPLNASARTAATTATAMTAGIQQGPLKCKKCRRALVARDSVVTHTPGQGQASFGYRKRDATLHISEVSFG